MTSPNEPLHRVEARLFRSTDDGADYRKEPDSRKAGRDYVHFVT